jgi:hypothetical protein
MSSNENNLFNTIERSIFTFNLNQITEICFEKLLKHNHDNMNKLNVDKEINKIILDNCVDKYFQTFKLVKEESIERIVDLINEYDK